LSHTSIFHSACYHKRLSSFTFALFLAKNSHLLFDKKIS